MSKNNNSDPNDQSIKVYCRLRPLNALEKSLGGQICITFNETSIKNTVQGDNHDYNFFFDRIFGEKTSQKEIFDIVARPVILGVMDGFNGTIFAYGQTSSGKTHTMEGPDYDDSEQKGIIPRMMDYVFDFILNAPEHLEFIVKCTMLEIYNEKIQDLLDPSRDKLQIKEDKVKGIYVQGSSEISVNNIEEMRKIMRTGSQNRTIAATRMNDKSSRSHRKLYFVDLAGSEKVGKTGAEGKVLDEAKNINKSLTSLGMVINALTSEKKEHVPYRILQESLGGNSKTSLILACSMCSYNDKETLSTLRFGKSSLKFLGQRAKSIKNKAIKNEERSPKELQVLLEAAEKKIKLQEDIIKKFQQEVNKQFDCDLSTIELDASFVEKKLDTIPEKNEKVNLEKKTTEKIIPDEITNEMSSPQRRNTKKNNSINMFKSLLQMKKMNEELDTIKQNHKDLENIVLRKQNEIDEVFIVFKINNTAD